MLSIAALSWYRSTVNAAHAPDRLVVVAAAAVRLKLPEVLPLSGHRIVDVLAAAPHHCAHVATRAAAAVFLRCPCRPPSRLALSNAMQKRVAIYI